MTLIKRDKWVDALLRLRRNHANEIRLFYSNESRILADLNRSHRFKLYQFTHPVDRAIAIRSQLDGLKRLDRERTMRLVALKNRHSEELHNLMRFKTMTNVE